MKTSLKKLFSIVTTFAVTAAMCLSMGGCSSSSKKDDSSFKVGAIYISSKNDTSGYTYAHHQGICKAMESLGLDPEKDLYVMDNVQEDKAQVLAAIDTLAGKGCKIIFGTSFGYLEAMNEAATTYPDIIFSHATGYLSNETNFNNYFGRIYQARYLTGIAAGYKSLECGNNNLGYVSAWGTEYAETCSGINAFALGAQSVNPDAVVHVNVISTWGDQELEKQAAEVLADTYDCCVIAQHCDSAQPQLVAEDKGIFGCGYNSDMAEQAPDAHLTAPVWNWNVYYELAIKTAMESPDDFMSVVGNYYGGLAEGMVDISPLTDNCTPETAEAIDLARNLMVDGKWDVFSGEALSFTGTEGSVEVAQNDVALVTNDGTEVVAAGGSSVEDSVIQGEMNYYVAGVEVVS